MRSSSGQESPGTESAVPMALSRIEFFKEI